MSNMQHSVAADPRDQFSLDALYPFPRRTFLIAALAFVVVVCATVVAFWNGDNTSTTWVEWVAAVVCVAGVLRLSWWAIARHLERSRRNSDA